MTKLRVIFVRSHLTYFNTPYWHMAERDVNDQGECLAYDEACSKLAADGRLEEGSATIDYIQKSGRLFQEWICMAWITVEDGRLDYQSFNQKKLRADTYKNIRTAVEARRATELPRGDMLYSDDREPLRVGAKILAGSLVGIGVGGYYKLTL